MENMAVGNNRLCGEKVAAGIDPARYSIQIALLSPTREYYNRTMPLSAKTVDEVKSLIPESAPVVVEGYATSGRLFFLELINKGIDIYELNPNLGKHLRILEKEGHSDTEDARSIARSGIYFPQRLGRIYLYENLESISVLVKMRQRIRKDLTSETNRCHALLSETYGDTYQELKHLIHSKKGRAFLHHFPSINALLKDEVGLNLKKKVRAEKPWKASLLVSSLEENIRFLLHKIELCETQIKDVDKRLESALSEIPQGIRLMRIPGIGALSAATILTEVKDIARFKKESKFAAYCGLAPCIWQSGKAKARGIRRKSYSRVLKGIFFNIAFTAVRIDDKAKAYYEKKIKEGKCHRQALLCVARQISRVVYATLKEK